MKKIFNSLKRREQQLVFSAAIFSFVVILLLINSFLHNQKNEAVINYQKSESLYEDVNKSLSIKSKVLSEEKINPNNLSSTVSSLARNFSLTIDRIQPTENAEIIVSINQAEFKNLYAWLKELELKKGVVLSKASIRVNSAKGNISGIRAQLVLRII